MKGWDKATMEQVDLDKLSRRLAEVEQEICALMPLFLRAEGDGHRAYVETDLWSRQLQPLFDEHWLISGKLRGSKPK